MINISYNKQSDFYNDYRLGLQYLNYLNYNDYKYPEQKTLFHIYTEIKTDKELECIKSFLATQNLEKTHLIIWSDYDINNNPLIQPYKQYLDLRVYNAKEEAKNTPLENSDKLEASDSKHYLQSDLLRLLILYKYGGIWVDMDIVFLRDFKPILDQEFMYQWGSETNFGKEGACATVLSMKKQSEFATKILITLEHMPIMKETTIWGKDLFALVWRQWPHFNIFPCSFFNTEWLISKVNKSLSVQIQQGWFKNNSIIKDYLFLDAFTWHWHNSSNKDKDVENGSKFDLLRKRTNKLLHEKYG